jgi:CheY-like chemotaxis protein
MDNLTEHRKKLSCILLVDDDEPTNFLHRIIIKKAGLDVHVQSTFSGEDALDYLTCKGQYSSNMPNFPKPGIILLDINMPGINGWEFLTEYNKLPIEQKADVLVAMLTTSLNPDDEQRAGNEKDLAGFLRKPLTIEMLKGLVSKYWPETTYSN